MRILPSKEYKPLYTQEYFEADLFGGRGRGGSHNLTLYALFLLVASNYFRGFFVRAIHGAIRDSLWADFKDRINEVSEINKVDYHKQFAIKDNEMKAVYLPNGNQLGSKGFRASTKGNTANMKSIAGATHIFIEECEEVGEFEYNKLADSLRTIKAPIQIIRSWNPPPKEHWLVNNYYNLIDTEHEGFYKLNPKGIDRHLSIFGTYKDNLKNINTDTIAKYLRYKETNPKYYLNQIMGLVSDGGDNKVYYNWKQMTRQRYEDIDGATVYGIDFGDVAPTALVEVKYKDGCFYRRQILYKSLRALNAQYKERVDEIRNSVDLADNEQNNIWTKHKGVLTYVFTLMGVDKDIPMFCDPAQRGLIIELRQAGFSAVQAKKDKQANINFINRASNFYTDDSPDIEKEYNSCYLETDVNGNPIDGKPKKGNDHILEASEYAVRGLKDKYGIKL